MSDEPAPITVTIKYGKSYDDSWAVFKGGPNQVADRIKAYFGLEDFDGTLHQLVQQATDIAHGKVRLTAVPSMKEAVAEVEEQLGGEVIEEEAEQEADKPDHSGLIAALNEAESTSALKRLWAENRAAFADSDVQAAYKKRGQALVA